MFRKFSIALALVAAFCVSASAFTIYQKQDLNLGGGETAWTLTAAADTAYSSVWEFQAQGPDGRWYFPERVELSLWMDVTTAGSDSTAIEVTLQVCNDDVYTATSADWQTASTLVAVDSVLAADRMYKATVAYSALTYYGNWWRIRIRGVAGTNAATYRGVVWFLGNDE